jgi:glycosyltransferase involved in cell wall biosynthesis
MSDLGLVMIVKNEEAVLERCLRSVLPFIATWCILDTGSTDRTQAIVQDTLRGIPGRLSKSPWKNFGHNRSEALAKARSLHVETSYSLMMDADDTFEGPKLPKLTHDAYYVPIQYGRLKYARVQIFSNALPWRYEGVVHEYPALDQPFQTGELTSHCIVVRRDGARAKDPLCYEKDARLLERELEVHPHDTRSQFYLAQSYRDAGRLEEALHAYRRRARMGGWEEEVFLSKLEAGRLMERLGRPFPDVVQAYVEAHLYRPSRAEALLSLADYATTLQKRVPPSKDMLFVDASAYE